MICKNDANNKQFNKCYNYPSDLSKLILHISWIDVTFYGLLYFSYMNQWKKVLDSFFERYLVTVFHNKCTEVLKFQHHPRSGIPCEM